MFSLSWCSLEVALALIAGPLLLCLFARTKSAKCPPIVSGWLPFIGCGIDFALSGNPVNFVRKAYDQHGDVFTLSMFGQRLTYLVGPEAHAVFFRAPESHVRQREVYKFTVPVFGKNIIYDCEPATMMDQLKTVASGLGSMRLKTYVDKMVAEAEAFFGAWDQEGEVDILDELSDLIIKTASRCLLGDEIRDHMNDEVAALYSDLDHGMTPISFFAPNLPTSAHRQRNIARKKMGELFSKVIQKRRSTGEQPEDFLQTLINARAKDGSELTDDQITGLLVAGLFAGQHTSSITSTWATLHAAESKTVMASLIEEQQELRARYGDRLDLQVLNDMKKLHFHIREALRMHPPLIFVMRKVIQDISYRDFVIPKGDIVVVSPSVSHRLGDVYKDPDTFDPSRFYEGREEDKQKHFSFVGFGGGRHACLGENFAYMQIKTIMACMLRKFRFELTRPLPNHDYTALVVGPEKPCNIKYCRL